MASNGITLQEEIAAYETQRSALIAKEKSLRHDHDFRQRLSPTAKQAAKIVNKIRAFEKENVWKKVGSEGGDVFPGMCFTLAKKRMEATKLWDIVRRFPKGALLHAHLEAMVDMDWLLDRALETEGMHIRSEVPLTAENLEHAVFGFQYCQQQQKTFVSIYSEEYKPETLVPLSVAVKEFPGDSFRKWFKSRTTITPEESMKHHEGIDAIWEKFQSVFLIINGIIYYEAIFRRFVREILHNVHVDGCRWVDMRVAFLMDFRATGSGEILPRHDVVRVYNEEVENYIKESGGEFWGSRVIWTHVRSMDAEIITETMRECIDAKVRYPSVVSAFDLVAQEDKGRTLYEHLPELLKFKRMCADADVEIPLYLHAGECLGDGDETDHNLFDAVLLGAKRIGHGYSMYKHPHLMELAKKHGICMEVCPISNEILRLTSSIMGHPLPSLLAHGVPVAISNDDPGILGQLKTGSLTHDFWQVLQAFDNVGLEGLGDLAETSVRYAAFDGVEVGVVEGIRKQKMELWTVQWEEFCQWVVSEYGSWA